MAILTSADFPNVRASIDLSLTVDDVPDAVIAMDEFQAEGEARVYERIPLVEFPLLSAADLVRVKTAAILFTAALIAESLPRVTQESIGRRTYVQWKSATTADMLSIAAGLRGRAEAALANVTSVIPADVRPRMFSLTGRGRGY